MNQYKQISVINDHHLTATEKKIILYMLNNEMTSGQVRNKIFNIFPLENQEAKIIIHESAKSIILNRDEWIKRIVLIKHK